MSNKKDDILVGGQAVIEGVMMRSPNGYSTALRRRNDEISVFSKNYISLGKKIKFFSFPFIRGIVSFFEMLIIGIKTLNLSADIAILDEENEKKVKNDQANKTSDITKDYEKTSAAIIMTMIFALFLGIALFFWLPLFLTKFIVHENDILKFNVIDTLIRIVFFLVYLMGISQMEDIKRVFMYHGAEHKTIFAYEHKEELTIENVKKYSRLHPRCGTNFIILVFIIAIVVFSIGDSLIKMNFSVYPFYVRLLVHLLFLPLIASISYEILRFSGVHEDKFIGKFLAWPGLQLQRITTKEPDDKQLEVAIEALKASLMLEKS